MPPKQMRIEPADLLDLMLVGFHWANVKREREPHKNPQYMRRMSQMLWTLHIGKAIGPLARRDAHVNPDLVRLTLQRGKFIQERRRPGLKVQRQLITECQEHFVVLVVPDATPVLTKIYGPEGYYFILTDAGDVYASEQTARFEERITQDDFYTAWRKNLERLAGAAKARETRGQRGPGTPGPDDTPWGEMPRANVGEEDFEF